jgi:hypothetical protein
MRDQSLKSIFATGHPARRVFHVAFWLFIVLGVIFWLGWLDVPGHDDEWALSYMAFGSALVMLLPYALVQSSKSIRSHINTAWLAGLEAVLFFAMTASWIGAFGLYRAGFGYDTGVHVFSSALAVFGVTLIVMAIKPDLAHEPLVLASIAFIVALMAGAGNELVEWSSDRFLGTVMYGEVGQPNDTLRDGIGDVIGVIAGTVFVVARRAKIAKKYIDV